MPKSHACIFHISIHPSIHPSIPPSNHYHSFIYPPTHPSTIIHHPFVHPPIHPTIHLPIHPPTHPPYVHPSLHWFSMYSVSIECLLYGRQALYQVKYDHPKFVIYYFPFIRLYNQSVSIGFLFYFTLFYFMLFFFLGLHLIHTEVPKLGVKLGAKAAGLYHNHSNIKSEPCLQPTP